MSDDAKDSTRKIVQLDPNVLTTWCAQSHDLREIELTRLAGTRYRVGGLPALRAAIRVADRRHGVGQDGVVGPSARGLLALRWRRSAGSVLPPTGRAAFLAFSSLGPAPVVFAGAGLSGIDRKCVTRDNSRRHEEPDL